jgi:hypothetical protein
MIHRRCSVRAAGTAISSIRQLDLSEHNHAQFRRITGTGLRADQIHQAFKTFTRRHGSVSRRGNLIDKLRLLAVQ